jgi:O-antigen/teichoic acid export membrane protein
MWTVLTWVFVPYLAIKFGVNGAALGYAMVGASSVIPIYIARRYVKFSLVYAVAKPGIAALIMFTLMFFIRNILPVNLLSVFVIGGFGFICYLICAYIIFGSSIIGDVKKISKAIFTR